MLINNSERQLRTGEKDNTAAQNKGISPNFWRSGQDDWPTTKSKCRHNTLLCCYNLNNYRNTSLASNQVSTKKQPNNPPPTQNKQKTKLNKVPTPPQTKQTPSPDVQTNMQTGNFAHR